MQKVLSEAGIASRRKSEELIKQGRVSVNGVPARLGQRIRPDLDKVQVDGEKVLSDPTKHYLMLNKPIGVVTTSSDPQNRTTVMDLIGEDLSVYPVGRLDIETEGMLLLTNDGELANRVAHPSHETPKTYVAEVKGSPDPKKLRRLTQGVDIGDERPARATKVRLLGARRGSPAATMLEVTIGEGRNRIVRRMFEAIGHPVNKLARTGIGPLQMGRLASGGYRKLTADEVAALYRAVDL